MQAKIETLKARNSSDEEYLVYPRTLTKCVTNENGENLDVIISNVVKDSDVTAIKGNVFIQEDAGETDYYVPIDAQLLGGYPAEHFVTIEDLENFSGGGGGASTAAQVSYDDTVGNIPFGADNVQGAFDNLKGILSTFDDYVNSKASETLEAAKAYTDENAGSGTGTHQFSISGKNLETGWYRIAKYFEGNDRPCTISLIDIKELDDGYAGVEATLFCDLYRNNVKVIRCKSECDGVDSYVGFDNFNVESIYDDEADEYYYYLCIHYTNPGHTSQICSMTITSVYDGEMNWEDDIVPLYFQPPENKIELVANTNNMSDNFNEFDLNANVDIVTTEDLKGIGSSHQYMLYSEGVLETGWYIIGRTMGMHSCNINIIDMGVMPGEDMPIFVQANVLSSELVEALASSVKILDFSIFGDTPYVGFDKIVTTQTEDENIVVAIHYTNPGCEEHNCILTITNLMGGELSLGNFSMNVAMQPYDGNTLTYLCDEFAEDALVGRISEFELKAQPDLADILARLEVLEAKGVSDILDPEGVEF